MKRIVNSSQILTCLIFINCSLVAYGQAKKTDLAKPNVLFIMTDQQSYNMMSFTGNKYISTPHLDKLAKRGYSFGKTYTTNPVCQPSRFSLMTGHYPSSVGIKENYRSVRRPRYEAYDDYIQKSYAYDTSKVKRMKKQAWGNIFRKAGYKTYYAGKRHLYTGFLGWGFTSYSKDPYNGPAAVAEHILPTVAKTKHHKPFLMFLSFMEPHDICYQGYSRNGNPNNDPKRLKHYRKLHKAIRLIDYLKELPPRKSRQPIKGENPEMFAFVSQHRDWSFEEWDLYRWLYYRLTETADEQIGRALNALKKSGLQKNTIVIFTSDHGDMQGAHGLVYKNVLLEEAQRVPFIFAGPGIKHNYVNKSILVSNGLDLLPTICDLVGLERPKGLRGISLEPYLTGSGKKPNRKYIISESFNAYQIADGRYKYTIYELPGHPEMLADLKIDPKENVNFADNPEYKKIKSLLKKKLMDDLSKRDLIPLPTDRKMKYLTPTRVVN